MLLGLTFGRGSQQFQSIHGFQCPKKDTCFSDREDERIQPSMMLFQLWSLYNSPFSFLGVPMRHTLHSEMISQNSGFHYGSSLPWHFQILSCILSSVTSLFPQMSLVTSLCAVRPVSWWISQVSTLSVADLAFLPPTLTSALNHVSSTISFIDVRVHMFAQLIQDWHHSFKLFPTLGWVTLI